MNIFGKYKKWILATVGILVLLYCSWLRRQGILDAEQITKIIVQYPRLAPLLFVTAYAVLTTALIPTLPLNIGAGYLWGTVWGAVFSVIGATSGAVISFTIARYFWGDFFGRRFHNPAWEWLHHEIVRYGWKAVAFTRINPFFSFGPLNYFFGVTQINFGVYVWATLVWLIPPCALIASLGESLGGFALDGEATTLLRKILFTSAIFTILVLLRLIINHKQDKTQQALKDDL